MNPTTLSNALRDSVQVLPDAKKDNGASASGFWVDSVARTNLLPAWGTRERERWLRDFDRNPYNTLWQGAAGGLIKKFVGTPHEIKGGRNLANYLDELTRYADFSVGFDSFKAKWARDYLRFDGGAWFEIIAPGNERRAPTARVNGLANFDSYYCVPTGDPNYPCVYTDREGKLHLMHSGRVNHAVDMPDADQNHPGYGLCALSRAIAIVERQILENRYIVTSLDDKPPPGMLLVGGLTKEQWANRWSQFRQEQGTDERPEWGRTITFHGADASLTPTVESVAFNTPPEAFDFKVYVELDVHEFALAIGVDIQELWELTGGNMGSSGQSQVQHAKSQGKTYGVMLSTFEHAMNNYVLPKSLEFAFKVRDPYEAQEQATHAQVWSGVVTQLEPLIGRENAAKLIASQVESVGDILYDEDGELIELPDVDPKEPNASQDVTVDDTAPNATAPTGQQATAQDSTPNASTGGMRRVKAFEDTRRNFEANLADLLTSGTDRRRAGVVMRAQLNSAGKAARNDGLAAGGVTSGLSDADLNAHTVWLAKQSAWVTDFLDSAKSGLSDAQIAQHVQMWSTKSLAEAYYEGLFSADKDGTYEFYGTDGEESCKTCRSLQGVKMRMSEWTARKLRPGVDGDSFACKGYQCSHKLSKVGTTKGLETEGQRRWFFAHLRDGGVARLDRLGNAVPSKSPAVVQTLDGTFHEDIGTPGESIDSLNTYLRTADSPLAYAMLDGNIGMVDVDYSGAEDVFSINRAIVKSEAAAFVRESQDIQYSREYILSLARIRAMESGVHVDENDIERLFNQQYAYRAQAIQRLAKIGRVSLTPAQQRRLQTAVDGNYLDMVYSRSNSDSGSLYNAATRRGGQRLSGAALREARQNFRDWVTIGA